jgi:hypothetical protein
MAWRAKKHAVGAEYNIALAGFLRHHREPELHEHRNGLVVALHVGDQSL